MCLICTCVREMVGDRDGSGDVWHTLRVYTHPVRVHRIHTHNFRRAQVREIYIHFFVTPHSRTSPKAILNHSNKPCKGAPVCSENGCQSPQLRSALLYPGFSSLYPSFLSPVIKLCTRAISITGVSGAVRVVIFTYVSVHPPLTLCVVRKGVRVRQSPRLRSALLSPGVSSLYPSFLSPA